MKVYYYHAFSIEERLRKWRDGVYPGHTLYGLTCLEKNGIDFHIFRHNRWFSRRILKTLYVCFSILLSRKKYDVLYATSQYGLELLIFMRALGIYRKPIAILHHMAVRVPAGWLRKWFSGLLYRGMDELFFFSDELLAESLRTQKVKQGKRLHWGVDLDYYDRFISKTEASDYFISTGCENRDLPTLIRAFSLQDIKGKLEVYITETWGSMNYKNILSGQLIPEEKVQLHLLKAKIDFGILLDKVLKSRGVIICCQKWHYHYPLGLSALVEAMALGKAVITTDNPFYGIDVEKEKIGLKIGYGDIEGWKTAVNYLNEHPDIAEEMGYKAKGLVRELYNLENFGRELIPELMALSRKES